MNSLFQQKQRELVLAMSKVEELTRQLEMLKNGRIDGHHDNQSAVAELDRLYKELQVPRGLLGAAAEPCSGEQSCPHKWQEVLDSCVFSLKGLAGRTTRAPKESRVIFLVPSTGNPRHSSEPQPGGLTLTREPGGGRWGGGAGPSTFRNYVTVD